MVTSQLSLSVVSTRGRIVTSGHELEQHPRKVLVFQAVKLHRRFVNLYRLKHNLAPIAILNAECETITAVGCIIAEIPCVDQIPVHQIPPGSLVWISGGLVSLEEPAKSTNNGGCS
jgi:predicted aconitase with swiveling domain